MSVFGRLAMLPVLFSILVLVAACAAPTMQPPPPPPSGNFCDRGNNSPVYPMICVNPSRLTADPPKATVYDCEPDGHGHPSNRPVTIEWDTQNRSDFSVVFVQKNCTIGEPDCKTLPGRCTARVAPLGGVKTRQCTYQMFSGTTKDDDGIVVVNPCCS